MPRHKAGASQRALYGLSYSNERETPRLKAVASQGVHCGLFRSRERESPQRKAVASVSGSHSTSITPASVVLDTEPVSVDQKLLKHGDFCGMR